MKRSWEHISDTDDAYDCILRNDLHATEFERAARKAYSLGVRDSIVTGSILRTAAGFARAVNQGRHVPFRPSPLTPAGVFIGHDAITGSRVHLQADDVRRHALLSGGTGSGKTVFAFAFLCSLILQPEVRGFWLVDSYKSELASLLPLFARMGRRAAVLTPVSTPFNLLQVPVGHEPLAHAAVVCDVLAASLRLPEGAARLLREAVHRLYTQHGVFTHPRESFPTLYDLAENLRANTDAHTASREALLDRLRELLQYLTPRAAAWRRGWMPAALSNRCIVWQFGGASETVKRYLLDGIVNGLLRDQLRRPAPGPWPDVVLFLDDCQRLISSGTGDRMSPLAETLLVCRSAGTSIILSHQSVEGVEPLLLSQAGTRLVGRLSHGPDWRWAQDALGLTQEQATWCRHHLEPGLFVYQTATGAGDRYPHLLRVPNAQLPSVSEAEIAASRSALDDLPLEPATEFECWEPWPVAVVTPTARSIPPITTPPTSEEPVPITKLSDAERRFLQAVIAQPGLPSSKYVALAKVSTRRAVEIRAQLVALGFVREHTVMLAGTGRPAVVLEPTENGRRAVTDSPPGGSRP